MSDLDVMLLAGYRERCTEQGAAILSLTTQLAQAQARLAEVERERDTQKERADAFWSCIREEMAENHQLFLKLGIIPQIEKAEQASIKLVNDAIDALQRENAELNDRVEYQAGYIEECKAEINDYVRELAALRARLGQ